MQHFLQVYYLTFICDSTCFGLLPAHHQEHTTALGASSFTVGGKGLALFLFLSWSGQSDHDQQRSSTFLPTVKPEASSAVVCS
jgi:hypothetical protein